MAFALDKPAFLKICERGALSADARAVAEAAFRAYRLRIDAIVKDLTDIVTRQVSIFERIRDGGPDTMTKADIIAVGVANRECKRRAKPVLLAAIAEFETALLHCGVDVDESRIQFALREWRRTVMLNERPEAWRDARDLEQHPDLSALAAAFAASDASAHLWFAADAGTSKEESPTVPDARSAIHQLLDGYCIELDLLLQSVFWQYFDAKGDINDLGMSGDERGVARVTDAASNRWLEVYRLNERVALSIATAIESSEAVSGEASLCAAAWRAAFFTRYFPSMYAEKSADFAYGWLTEQEGVTAEQRLLLDTQFAAHAVAREAVRALLRRQLFEIVTIEHQQAALVGAMHKIRKLNSARADSVYATKERMRLLNDGAIKAFRDLVDPTLTTDFDDAVTAARERRVDGDTMEF